MVVFQMTLDLLWDDGISTPFTNDDLEFGYMDEYSIEFFHLRLDN